MNIRSIEYFLTAVEEMNVTRAAERLFISQQALSSHIKRLEDEYHVDLFTRRPSFHLTPEGEEMAFYGRQLLETEAKMRAAFSDISQNCLATLNVGISRLRGDVFFPLIWKFYHPSHSNISIELVDGKSSMLDELLQAGKIDLYIGIDIPESPNQQGLVYKMSRNGDGAGLLSPVIFYRHMHDPDTPGSSFHVFPILNDIPDNILYLVYRKDYPLPKYAMDFIEDATMVFHNYSRSINLHFSK